METISVNDKAKNFFEYMLALNNLVGKVVRDYTDFEKNWQLEDLDKLDGCFTLENCPQWRKPRRNPQAHNYQGGIGAASSKIDF